MEIYQNKPRIKLSPTVRHGRKFIEVSFDHDGLRLPLSKEEGLRHKGLHAPERGGQPSAASRRLSGETQAGAIQRPHGTGIYRLLPGFSGAFQGTGGKGHHVLNGYLLYLIRERNISSCQQNQRINAIKFYYEKVLGQERRCYKVNRAKREKTLPDVLSKEEIKRILDVAAKDLRFFCMFSILYSAGLRISELLELKPGDINESRNLIRVRQGKGKKDRYTLLSRPLMKKLAEYNRLYKPKVWLFERRPGEPFTESIVSKRLKAAAQEAGITKRIYPHLLRHSFATHLLEQGTDIKIVKELMGHNNIKTTERYVHIADTYKSNIKSPLDDLIMEDNEV